MSGLQPVSVLNIKKALLEECVSQTRVMYLRTKHISIIQLIEISSKLTFSAKQQ